MPEPVYTPSTYADLMRTPQFRAKALGYASLPQIEDEGYNQAISQLAPPVVDNVIRGLADNPTNYQVMGENEIQQMKLYMDNQARKAKETEALALSKGYTQSQGGGLTAPSTVSPTDAILQNLITSIK